MKKQIDKFHFNDYSFLIDLADAPAAVAVNRLSGDILLNEGSGEDRYEGAAIFPRDFRGFKIVDQQQAKQLWLGFGDDRWHPLGTTTGTQELQQWVSQAERIIRSNMPVESSVTENQNTMPY